MIFNILSLIGEHSFAWDKCLYLPGRLKSAKCMIQPDRLTTSTKQMVTLHHTLYSTTLMQMCITLPYKDMYVGKLKERHLWQWFGAQGTTRALHATPNPTLRGLEGQGRQLHQTYNRWNAGEPQNHIHIRPFPSGSTIGEIPGIKHACICRVPDPCCTSWRCTLMSLWSVITHHVTVSYSFSDVEPGGWLLLLGLWPALSLHFPTPGRCAHHTFTRSFNPYHHFLIVWNFKCF